MGFELVRPEVEIRMLGADGFERFFLLHEAKAGHFEFSLATGDRGVDGRSPPGFDVGPGLELVRIGLQPCEGAAVDHAVEDQLLFLQSDPPARLRRLTLQGIQLLLDLGDDVVDPQEILLGGIEFQLGLTTARPVLRDPGSFFNQRAAIRGFVREDLTDLSLFDERVRLRTEARVHEEFVNVAKPAHRSIHQVFALAVSVQPP